MLYLLCVFKLTLIKLCVDTQAREELSENKNITLALKFCRAGVSHFPQKIPENARKVEAAVNHVYYSYARVSRLQENIILRSADYDTSVTDMPVE